MKSIILAAGKGTQLSPLTNHKAKCMVELGGTPLLIRQIFTLRDKGIENIAVVAGYCADSIRKHSDIQVILNERYDVTNMVESLFCAQDLLTGEEDILISYGDIVYEPKVLEALESCTAPMCLAIDKQWLRYWKLRMDNPLDDAETLKLDADGRILELGRKPKSLDDIQGQYMGLIKVRADHVSLLNSVYQEMDPEILYDGKDFSNMYMTSFIQHLINLGWQVQSAPVDNGWLEVDTVGDLDLYHQMMAEGTLDSFYQSQIL